MSDEKLDHAEDLKSTSRRSRKDQQGRDYMCGCGKRYLSYPALYTHIKTKHDGHQPQGTQKSGLSHPSNRKIKPKIDDRILKNIINLVSINNLKILTQLDQNAYGYIAVPYRIKKQHVGKEIGQAFQNLIKNNSLILDKKTPLETILVCYLLGVGQYTSQSLFQYYQNFSRLFLNCFHQHGSQIYNHYFRNNDKRKIKTINTQQCKMAPIICDFFIRYYILFQNQNPDFISIMELICCDFCQWMYNNKWTIVQTSMNKNYSITRKNIIEDKNKKQYSDKDQDKYQKDYSQSHHSSQNQSIDINSLAARNKYPRNQQKTKTKLNNYLNNQ